MKSITILSCFFLLMMHTRLHSCSCPCIIPHKSSDVPNVFQIEIIKIFESKQPESKVLKQCIKASMQEMYRTQGITKLDELLQFHGKYDCLVMINQAYLQGFLKFRQIQSEKSASEGLKHLRE